VLVIFDLDGVLVDACEWHRLALNEALMEIANTQISLSDHYGVFNGIPTRVKLEKLIKIGSIKKEQCDSIYELKQVKTVELIKKLAVVRKEKVDLIKSLKSDGHKVACFTNSIRMTANLMLEKTGIIDLFDLILSNQDVEKPKPDPCGYIKAMEYFSFSPEKTLIVEDSPKGIEAAKLSGANVMIVSGPDEVNIENVKLELDKIL